MKITIGELRQIIKEEVEKVLKTEGQFEKQWKANKTRPFNFKKGEYALTFNGKNEYLVFKGGKKFGYFKPTDNRTWFVALDNGKAFYTQELDDIFKKLNK